MESFHECMNEYREQLRRGAIQQAYRGLMEYMTSLRTQLRNKHPDYSVSGSIYPGSMDMSYFSFSPASLDQRKLKVAIVFVHEAFRFEVWLAGYNKQIQSKYWKWFKESGWDRYRLVPTTKGADSIIEHVLAAEPNFRDLGALTEQIERESLRFIGDVEEFLASHGG